MPAKRVKFDEYLCESLKNFSPVGYVATVCILNRSNNVKENEKQGKITHYGVNSVTKSMFLVPGSIYFKSFLVSFHEAKNVLFFLVKMTWFLMAPFVTLSYVTERDISLRCVLIFQ